MDLQEHILIVQIFFSGETRASASTTFIVSSSGFLLTQNLSSLTSDSKKMKMVQEQITTASPNRAKLEDKREQGKPTDEGPRL
jgi:hypothetical protein